MSGEQQAAGAVERGDKTGQSDIDRANEESKRIKALWKDRNEEERVERRGDAHRGIEKAASDLLAAHPDLSVDAKLEVARIMSGYGKEAAELDQMLKDEWWQNSSDDDGRSPLTDVIGHGQALERAGEAAQEKLAKLASDLTERRGY